MYDVHALLQNVDGIIGAGILSVQLTLCVGSGCPFRLHLIDDGLLHASCPHMRSFSPCPCQTWLSKSGSQSCAIAETDLAVIGQQYPFEPLEYQRENLRLPFSEGIKMLQEAGFQVLSQLLPDNIPRSLQCATVIGIRILMSIDTSAFDRVV